MDDNRKKALAAALGQIEKQFGKGSVMRLGDSGTAANIEAVSTGSIGLDVALGIGGVPKGRVVEVYGPESSGKTTLTLQIVAEAQKQGGTAAFVDAEHALDPTYAENWASTSTNCWFRSLTLASRRWRSPTCWFAPVRSTLSWSIRSQR